MGDHYGKFKVIAAATLACALGSAGAATAPSIAWLVGWRALSGATGAGIIALAIAFIGDAVPYERRQATIARFLTGSILGMATGQLIGGTFTDLIGWRGAFAFLATSYVVVGSLLLIELRREAAAWSATQGPVLRAGPLRMLTQMRNVLDIAWARTILVFVSAEAMLFFGAIAFIPSYLNARFEVPLSAAGAIAACYGLGGVAYTFVAQRLIARHGERGLAAGGGLVLCASFAAVLLGPGWGWSLGATPLLGFGFYMLHNTLQANATQMAPHWRGTAVSLFAAAMYFAQSIGIALAAVVVDRAGAAWLFAGAAIALPLVGAGFAHLIRARPPYPPRPAPSGS
jgi:predicted MFS family arabinose efflux permease